MQAPRFQSDRLKQKKRQLRKFKSIAVVVLFVLILAGATYVSQHPGLRVEQILVSDVVYADRSAIELRIKETLSGRYFGLFARSNSFFVPRGAIKRTLYDEFPSIRSINIDVRGRHAIAVRITEYEAVAKWCDTPVTPAPVLTHEEGSAIAPALPQIPNDRLGTICYMVNDAGTIFAKAAGDHAGMVSLYGRLQKDPIGQQYVSKEQLQSLLSFVRLVRRLEIVVTEVWTTTGEAFAFVTEPGAQLYVSAKDDAVAVFTNLETVIKRDAINKAQFANLAYIDLRFGNRVFYKLR